MYYGLGAAWTLPIRREQSRGNRQVLLNSLFHIFISEIITGLIKGAHASFCLESIYLLYIIYSIIFSRTLLNSHLWCVSYMVFPQ